MDTFGVGLHPQGSRVGQPSHVRRIIKRRNEAVALPPLEIMGYGQKFWAPSPRESHTIHSWCYVRPRPISAAHPAQVDR